jgi:hypothetical protein
MTKPIVAFRNFVNALKNCINNNDNNNNNIVVRVNLLSEVIFHELLIVNYRSIQFIDKQA